MGELSIHMTLDYEVWGNGSGCVIDCMINPTNKLLDIADRYNIKTTLFVDVCEYWAFKESEENNLFKDDSYKPASFIEAQLKDAVKRGHDIQLHLHPQWLNYKFIDDKKFEIDPSLWQISALKLGDFNSVNTLKWVFKKGKETLENIICPIYPSYSCKTFRAGAWCIQPEKNVLEAMKSVGITADSTVASGMELNDTFTKYNFKSAPNKSSWKFDQNVCIENEGGLFTEYPIHTTKYSWSSQIYYYLKRIGVEKYKPKKCYAGSSLNTENPILRIARKLIQQTHMFDFTSGKSSSELLYQYRKAEKKYSTELEKGDVDIVAIGHPKNFHSENELINFFEEIELNRNNIIKESLTNGR